MIDSIAFDIPKEATIEVIDSTPIAVPDVCRHFPNGVSDDNHVRECDADFIFIGEAADKNEAELGRPVVGEVERRLRDWWRPHGITQAQAYITCVYPFRPSKDSNDISVVPASRLAGFAEILCRKIDGSHARIIVPTGNTALCALFGNERTITDWRGSVVELERSSGKTGLVVPTFHPAATFKRPVLSYFCEADWARIAWLTKNEFVAPQREHIIDPDYDDYRYFIDGLANARFVGSSNIPAMAIDIENQYWKTEPGNITCIGFSYRPDLSITIPTHRRDLNGDIQLIERNWGWVRELCGWDIDKILQNGLYDQYHMVRKAGIWFHRYAWDLIEMDHCLNPNDGGTIEGGEGEQEGMKMEMRSLAVLTSLYTWQPYYKHMASSPNPAERLVYNGLDACVTREIFDPLWMKLHERGMV